ncbi:unnamed protein product [Diatraea saccharalis]|uniref:Uncharacterized protein n=1 Tax=Diatraea saccharalis TaxID=40085 RepID=A0A9N9W788_9NEOP|nr:unnamed protein product [Diatraea saccharalis]
MNFLYLTRSILRPNVTKIIAARYISQHPVKFIETERRWREKDNVPKHWELIYKAPMERWLNYLSVYLTFSTTTVGFGGLYYAAFVFDINTVNNPVILGDDIVVANSGFECFVYLAAFVGFHAGIKILLSKYVLRLYQDGDNYLAIFGGHVYNQIKKHKFHLNDFKRLNPTFVVSWGDARFSLGNKHAIILENYFKTPEYFNYLLFKRNKPKIDD